MIMNFEVTKFKFFSGKDFTRKLSRYPHFFPHFGLYWGFFLTPPPKKKKKIVALTGMRRFLLYLRQFLSIFDACTLLFSECF